MLNIYWAKFLACIILQTLYVDACLDHAFICFSLLLPASNCKSSFRVTQNSSFAEEVGIIADFTTSEIHSWCWAQCNHRKMQDKALPILLHLRFEGLGKIYKKLDVIKQNGAPLQRNAEELGNWKVISSLQWQQQMFDKHKGKEKKILLDVYLLKDLFKRL